MKKINFINNSAPDLSAETLNQMQSNIEESCVVVSPTEPTTNEKVWIQKGKNIYNPNTMPLSTGLWGNSNTQKIVSNSGGKFVIVPIQGGNTITISKEGNAIYYATTSTYPAEGASLLDNWTGSETINKVTITTNQNANYLFLGLYSTTKLMVEYNSTATEYEAYVEKAIHTKNDNGVYEEFYNENDYKIETVTTGTGTAIKFPDGTMICSGTVSTGTIEQSAWSEWGSLKSIDKSLSINFPVPFISAPSITATNSVLGNNFFIVRCAATATQITSLSMSRGTLPSSSTYGFSYTAIGRWK